MLSFLGVSSIVWIQLHSWVILSLVMVSRLTPRRLRWFRTCLYLIQLEILVVSWVGLGWVLLLSFCRGIFVIAAPLTNLTHKGIPFRWSDDCEESYRKLQVSLTIAPILVLPTTSGPHMVFCDASLIVLSVVLMQKGRMIAYASLKLKPHDNNYQVHV